MTRDMSKAENYPTPPTGEPFEFGAYAPQKPGELVNPKHIVEVDGVPHVPVRIYRRPISNQTQGRKGKP